MNVPEACTKLCTVAPCEANHVPLPFMPTALHLHNKMVPLVRALRAVKSQGCLGPLMKHVYNNCTFIVSSPASWLGPDAQPSRFCNCRTVYSHKYAIIMATTKAPLLSHGQMPRLLKPAWRGSSQTCQMKSAGNPIALQIFAETLIQPAPLAHRTERICSS
jgi:hypothetical protein